ncbi:hypothetical protein Tco_0349655 [Tanacetum coccineum]
MDVQNGQIVAGEMMDTVIEETYQDNIKLATKSIIKIMSEESNRDAWSSYSPIDEWSDQEEVNNKEPDVNYDPYLDIARLFNSHTKKEEGKDDQGKNKSIGEQDNHLVRGHERCGKSKLIEDPRTKSTGCKTEGFEVVKYIFGPTERYVAIKKHGEYEWTTTEENACHAYQDIFHKMDEGWSVTRAE